LTAVRPTFAFRLATAHLAAALLTLAALIFALLSWTRPELDWFDAPARIVQHAGLIYLLVTASLALDTALALRRSGSIDRRSWPLVAGGHSSVVAMAAAALLRGANSRTLHAGLDVLLAALAAVGSLAMILALVTWRCTEASGAERTPPPRGAWIRWTLQAWVCLLVVAALIYLEIQPLPKFCRRS
jgi:hypothetical protein